MKQGKAKKTGHEILQPVMDLSPKRQLAAPPGLEPIKCNAAASTRHWQKRQAEAITPPLKKIQLCYYILLMSTDSNHLCNHDPLGKAQTINLQIQNHKSLTNT